MASILFRELSLFLSSGNYDENGDGFQNICLLTIQPPDTVDSPKEFY